MIVKTYGGKFVIRLNSMPRRYPSPSANMGPHTRGGRWMSGGSMAKEPKPGCIFVVIEIPRGSRNKYEIDHRDNRVYLDRRLFTATMYPADYGFVPETLGGDGDPLDALVLLDDPVYPGVWVEARPVGVLYMQDEAGEDAKLICVPPGEPRWSDVHDISHLTPQLMAEIQHFFEVYKALEPNKYSSTSGIGNREDAWREIDDARANYVPD
jgi:inorganic pyrophosphatase